MKEIIATVTERGQVTVPSEVRRLLGIEQRGKVAFTIIDGEVRLTPARHTLASAYRSIPPLKQPLSDAEMIRHAKEQRARRQTTRARGR